MQTDEELIQNAIRLLNLSIEKANDANIRICVEEILLDQIGKGKRFYFNLVSAYKSLV